jgi:hypothetical protein
MGIVDMLGSAATLANEDTAGAVEHHDTDARPIREGFESGHRYVLLFDQASRMRRLTRAYSCRAAILCEAGTDRRRIVRSRVLHRRRGDCAQDDGQACQFDRVSLTGFWRRPR